MRIERAEVIPLEVPLTRTFYGGTYSMNRRCTFIIGGYYAEDKGAAGLIEEIFEYREAGYAGVKFKVGGRPPEEDVARVRQVRQAIGDDFLIAWPPRRRACIRNIFLPTVTR